MFTRIDTSGDRRIELKEFIVAASEVSKWGVKVENPEETFK
jgi:hypothetical protein